MLKPRDVIELRRVAPPFAASVFFAVAIISPERVAAAALKCESHLLQRDDELRLITAARAALPQKIEPFVTHPCRNPGSAHAGIMTAHVKTGAGVIHWWELACQRESEDWKCDPPRLKQFSNTRLLVGAKPRRVALSFDENTTLTRAEQLAAQALTIYADPASRLPWCSREDPQDSDWRALRQRNPLPVGDRPIRVSVTHDGGIGSVTFDDIQVEIRFPIGLRDTAPGSAECWNEWVVVT
jgi:hypothetical protein